jgi:hypothetical protein
MPGLVVRQCEKMVRGPVEKVIKIIIIYNNFHGNKQASVCYHVSVSYLPPYWIKSLLLTGFLNQLNI